MIKLTVTVSNKDYFERHFQLCQTCKSQQEAYEKLEDEVKEATGKNKFATYDAFRMAKTRYYSNHR